jgi:hypothetical protein
MNKAIEQQKVIAAAQSKSTALKADQRARHSLR